MTIALEKDSNEIVHGSALKALDDEHIQKSTYICPDDKCHMLATPSSYKDTNTPASYFKYKAHSSDCIVTQKNKKSKNIRSATMGDFCSYIDELKEPTVHKPRSGVAKQVTPNNTTPKPQHIKQGKTSRYLDAAIDYYLDETTEATNQKLKLPRHPSKTYKQAFQLITNNKQYNSGHIFYSKLQFNKLVESIDECITLTLLPEYSGNKYRVKINTSKWSNQKKIAFNLTCSNLLSKAKEHYISRKKKNKSTTDYPYIFFFSSNPIINVTEFEVEHFEFVSLRFLKQLHLPFNNKGIKRVAEVAEV
ncbi:hypothetical protein, partial [Aliivibrio fischeri]|uniref:hypothetical protein n=1 Tax=Aliivibrio fischeri TaxID=668 RepID=UPI00080E45EF